MSLLPHLAGGLAVLHLLTAAAFGYGNAGHQVIGDIAAHYLQGTRAGEEVAKLLRDKETLATAATWPDRAKLPEKYLTEEMKEFVAQNPEHHVYHYCDIPFQESAYREDSIGAGPNDIVHVMGDCIAVLQSAGPEPKNPRQLTRRVAFFLLAHLVGDIHQPLHVGTSYVDADNHFVNPNSGATGLPDAGGNYFKLTKTTSLHGYWDTVTVKNAKEKAAAGEFADYLIAQHPAQAEWKATGPPRTLPAQWATETLQLSEPCFKGITLTDRTTVPAEEKRPEHVEWKVTLPPGYETSSADTVELELAKAGWRLAEILQAIWP